MLLALALLLAFIAYLVIASAVQDITVSEYIKSVMG